MNYYIILYNIYIQIICQKNNYYLSQSNENLIKDIQEFQKKYEKIYNELPILKEKLIKLKTLCDFNDLNSKKENEEILKINLVLTNIM